MADRPLAPIHLNSNLLAAVKVETTGPIPGTNDIAQVAIIPLAPDYSPHPNYGPIDFKLKPIRLRNFDDPSTKIPKEKWVNLINSGLEASMAAELLEDWFKQLNLPLDKNIVPIGHNYCQVDRPFLLEWLGLSTYNFIFSPFPRDALQAALFINDLCDWRAEVVPFARFRIGALCRRLGIERTIPRDAISEALAAAECYKRILGYVR